MGQVVIAKKTSGTTAKVTFDNLPVGAIVKFNIVSEDITKGGKLTKAKTKNVPIDLVPEGVERQEDGSFIHTETGKKMTPVAESNVWGIVGTTIDESTGQEVEQVIPLASNDDVASPEKLTAAVNTDFLTDHNGVVLTDHLGNEIAS